VRAIVFLFFFLISSLASASSVHVPTRRFSIKIHGKYAESWVIVFKHGTQWACQTNTTPFLSASSDPISDLSWTQFHSLPAESCRDKAEILDQRSAKEKTVETCLDLPEVRSFYEAVLKNCGSV
jgi:hypothetical protein